MNVNIDLNDLIKTLVDKASFNSLELTDGFDKYLSLTRHTHAEETYKCYKSHSQTVVKDLAKEGIIYFNQIEDKVIFRYVEKLKLRGCKNSTINKNIQVLTRAYKYLAKLGFLPVQDFTFKQLKETLPPIVIIDEPKLKKILDYSKTLSDRSNLLILIMVSTGIRRTELSKVRIQNIDIQHNRIYLIDTKSGIGRYVQYDPTLKDLILRVSSLNQTFLFENPDGSHITPNAISMVVKRMAEKLGISGLSPHKFRHTYATMLLKNGANIGAVRLLMGHSSLSVTHRYLDFTSDELDNINTLCNPLAKVK